MLKFLCILILNFSFLTTVQAGGFFVGNDGGLAVRCSGEMEMKSYDYMIGRMLYGKKLRVPRLPLDQSLKRISRLLGQKAPQLHDSFQEFVELLGNTDYSKRYVWKKSYYELTQTNRDHFSLPSTCRSSYGAVEISQAIVRKAKSSGQVVFEYDDDVVLMIGRTSLQMSFLIVHEWLWSLTRNPETNIRINYFLHSILVEQMSSQEVALKFKEFAL